MRVSPSTVEVVLGVAIAALTVATGELFLGLVTVLLLRIVAILDDIRRSLDRLTDEGVAGR